jgi:hypothetical protein
MKGVTADGRLCGAVFQGGWVAGVPSMTEEVGGRESKKTSSPARAAVTPAVSLCVGVANREAELH